MFGSYVRWVYRPLNGCQGKAAPALPAGVLQDHERPRAAERHDLHEAVRGAIQCIARGTQCAEVCRGSARVRTVKKSLSMKSGPR